MKTTTKYNHDASDEDYYGDCIENEIYKTREDLINNLRKKYE